MTKEKQKESDPAPQNKVTNQDKLEDSQKDKDQNGNSAPDPTGRN